MKKYVILCLFSILVGFGGFIVGFNTETTKNALSDFSSMNGSSSLSDFGSLNGTGSITDYISGQDASKLGDGLKFIQELEAFLRSLNPAKSVAELKVVIAEKIYELSNSEYNSSTVDYIAVNLLSGLNGAFSSGSSLINSLLGNLTTSINTISSGVDSLLLDYDETVQITSKTAALSTEAGSSYSAKLNGYIYYAKEKSTKWVVLLHGYMMNGKLMAQSAAKMYLDNGYNVLAPDLRGFGKSEGSVAMGYLESLDTWDWLTYINNGNNKYIGDRAATEVIIHGVSLGGATTLQTWTQVNMGRDLTTKNVIGLVDDCGYDSMTGIIRGMLSTDFGKELLSALTGKESFYDIVGDDNVKKLLMNTIKVGIKEKEFDLKQDAFYNGSLGVRKMSDVPLYIIHGTADTTVPFSISKNVVSVKAREAGLLYKFWEVANQPHAFIIVGIQKANYQSNLYSFINYAENRAANKSSGKDNSDKKDDNSDKKDDDSSKKDDNSDKKEDTSDKKDNSSDKKENKSFFEKAGDAISDFFNSIKDFFVNLFS